MTARTTKKKPPAYTRKPSHRENTSTIVLFPWQVADELLVSEDEVHRQMSIGVQRGGLRAICLGDPSSARPRRVVHKDDFALWLEYKRGLLTLEEYAQRAGGAKA